MTTEKLIKEIAVELSEARAANRDNEWRIVKACLLHIRNLIDKNVKA